MTEIPQTPDSGHNAHTPPPPPPGGQTPVDPSPGQGGCCCGSPQTLGTPPQQNTDGGTPPPVPPLSPLPGSMSGALPGTPAPQGNAPGTGGTAGSDKRDILKTSPVEQAEIEHFIAKGHGAHSTVFLLSLLGIFVVFLGAMYWNHFDFYRDGEDYVQFGKTMLPALIENQNKRDWRAYQPRQGVRTEPPPPHWPEILYRKVRFDSYLIAGLAFLLALIMIHIEKAKMRRNDLLIFRAMAREIEKLRMRLRQLERKGKGDDPSGPA